MDLLVNHISTLCTMNPSKPGLGLIEDAAAAFKEGKIAWVGKSVHAPTADKILDAKGLIGLPGLVDPHTHTVYSGSRANEFAQRLAGANYSDILEAGGGILSTVQATRQATLHQLTQLCRQRLQQFRKNGVTTVEIKSGYGLDPQTEKKMLQAALQCNGPMRVITTFLGAHTIPAEYKSNRDAYVRQIIEQQLPLCAPFADAIDVYCDRGAFTLDESIAILSAGKRLGLKVRAHAEQVSHTGIAGAAAELGAICVDHLERVTDNEITSMANNGTVAVLLPGAQLYLKDSPPPVHRLRAAGVPMAIGTDLNPGSSPVHNIWTCATLACILQGLTIEEALIGMTRNAGRALGRPELGWIGRESIADLGLYLPPPGEPPRPESLIQHMGTIRLHTLIKDGQVQ